MFLPLRPHTTCISRDFPREGCPIADRAVFATRQTFDAVVVALAVLTLVDVQEPGETPTAPVTVRGPLLGERCWFV